MLMDMGKKSKMSMPETAMESHKHYPSFSLSGDMIPDELANKKVGQMCRLEIMVKKVGDSISSYVKGEKRVELEIHKMGYMGHGKVSKDEYDKMSEEEKNRADEKEVFGDDEE